jgi:hypothetical protein
MAKKIYITTKALSDGGDNFSRFYFDAITSFKPVYSQKLSKHVLSNNATINQHLMKDNTVVSIRGTVSKTPLTSYPNSLVSYTDKNSRPSDAAKLLYSWWNAGTLLYFEDEYYSYSNYILLQIEPVYEGKDSVTFDLTFEKARFVGYQRVKLIQYADTSTTKDGSSTKTESVETKEDGKDSNNFNSLFLQELGNLGGDIDKAFSLTDIEVSSEATTSSTK